MNTQHINNYIKQYAKITYDKAANEVTVEITVPPRVGDSDGQYRIFPKTVIFYLEEVEKLQGVTRILTDYIDNNRADSLSGLWKFSYSSQPKPAKPKRSPRSKTKITK